MANLIEIIVKAKDEATEVIKDTKKESEGLGAAFTKMGAVSGLALAAVGAESIKMATTYEAATTRLVTSAGETQAGLATVSKGMLNMAGSTSMGANELAKGMYTIESAGFHGADGLLVLKAAAQGAKAEGAELATVGNAVTDVLVDYHLKASDAADVTSQMITAVSHGKTSFEEFSGSMHNILPLAAAMGLKFADVAGVLAEMTSHGMSADQASQNMANAMRSLLGPTAAMKTEFKAVGTSADEVHQKLSTEGLSGTLEFLAEKAKAVSPNLLDQEAAMRKLIGTAPGLSVALMTTGENFASTTAAVKDIAGATADATGAVKGYAEYQKTLKGEVDQLGASFEDLMIKLGDKLIPVVKDVVGWLDKNHGVVLKVIGAVGTLAAGIAAYTLVTKTAALATSAWSAAQKLLVVSEDEATTATVSLGLAMKALPLFAVATAVTALSGGFSKLPAYVDPTTASVSDLTSKILDVNAGSGAAAQSLDDLAIKALGISQAIHKPAAGFQDLDQALADLVTSGHADQAQTAVEDITGTLTKQGVSLGYIHDQVLPKYNAALADQANQARETAGAINGLTDAQANATDTVSQATSAYGDAKKAATGYLDTIDALYGRFGNLSDAQAAFTLALADGAKSITAGTNAVNLNTVAGATNVQTFERMAKAAETVAGKMVEQNRDTAGATQSLQDAAGAIDALAAKSHLTKDQIKQLNIELFGVPDVKMITIDANTAPAANALNTLGSKIEFISTQIGQIGKGGNAAMFRATGGEVGAAATGGDRSGLVWVGEQGPELVRLPTGSTVRSNPDSMAALAGAHAAPATVQVEWVGPHDVSDLMTLIKRWIRFKYGSGDAAVLQALGQSY